MRHVLASLSRAVALEVLDPRTAMKSVPPLENYLVYSTQCTFPRGPGGYCTVPRMHTGPREGLRIYAASV